MKPETSGEKDTLSQGTVPTTGHVLSGVGLIVLFVFTGGCIWNPNVASQPDSVAKPKITDFASLSWGSSPERITDSYGPPDRREDLGYEGEKLIYRNVPILNEKGSMIFSVHHRNGLFRGDYTIRFGGGSNCETSFLSLKRALRKRLDPLQPNEDKTYSSSMMAYCSAVSRREARWNVAWTDPVNDASVTLRMPGPSNPETIRVTFETSVYREGTDPSPSR